MRSILILLIINFASYQSAEIGDVCYINGTEGQCSLTRECASTLKAWRTQLIFPTLCDEVTRTSCCLPIPESERPINIRPSVKMCQVYKKILNTTNSCLPAEKTNLDQVKKIFPHFASIGFKKDREDPNSKIIFKCAGSLVSKQWIISSAFCTFDKILKEAKWAKLGFNATTTNLYEIVQRARHPQYIAGMSDHDIALLKLENPIEFNRHVGPICLALPEATIPSKAIATRIKSNDNQEFEFFKLSNCKDELSKDGIENDSQICFRKRNINDLDIGGPLQNFNQETCTYTLIGVKPFGTDRKNSDDFTGVYTKVAYYLEWIEETVF